MKAEERKVNTQFKKRSEGIFKKGLELNTKCNAKVWILLERNDSQYLFRCPEDLPSPDITRMVR
jgi:hypothetical protein